MSRHNFRPELFIFLIGFTLFKHRVNGINNTIGRLNHNESVSIVHVPIHGVKELRALRGKFGPRPKAESYFSPRTQYTRSEFSAISVNFVKVYNDIYLNFIIAIVTKMDVKIGLK